MNCNPETVSTDYDTSDRLYFEPLTAEDVLEVVEREKPEGVILQFGGQTPLALARAARGSGRSRPRHVGRLDRSRRGPAPLRRASRSELAIPVPEHGIARTREEVIELAAQIGFPLMVRPSYVLGGQRMIRVYDEPSLTGYLDRTAWVDAEHPLFLDRFLEAATEVDVDALCDGATVWIAGIQQHVEMAGIHSGDSTSVLPPDRIAPELLAGIREATEKLGVALGVVGLLNIQFAISNGRIYVLEANPRASRTIPFVSRAIGLPLAGLATRLLLGATVESLGLPAEPRPPRSFVKMPVFPFRRFPDNDTILGPEMRSTGEVLGIGDGFGPAFAKACMAAGIRLPVEGTVFLSVNEADKRGLQDIAASLSGMGFRLIATRGTAAWLEACGIPCGMVFKVNEGHPQHRRPDSSGGMRSRHQHAPWPGVDVRRARDSLSSARARGRLHHDARGRACRV